MLNGLYDWCTQDSVLPDCPPSRTVWSWLRWWCRGYRRPSLLYCSCLTLRKRTSDTASPKRYTDPSCMFQSFSKVDSPRLAYYVLRIVFPKHINFYISVNSFARVLHQYKVRSIQDLVSLKDSDRRNMLRFLGEEKYDEVIAVLGSFPHITMETKLQGRERRLCFSGHVDIWYSKWCFKSRCLFVCFFFFSHYH